MSLTVLEASKLAENDPLKAGILETLAVSSEFLNILPFESISGSAIEYVQEKTLPTIGARAVNESYTAGVGEVKRLKAGLKIAGGKIAIDTALVTMMGEGQKVAQIQMKTKAMAGYIEKQLIKGDSDANAETFDGLQKLVSTAQTVANGTAGLKLTKLDEALDLVASPQAIIMNKAMRRHLIVASKNASVGGHVGFEVGNFGQRITTYAGIPIITIGKDNLGAEILDFGEASTTSSIYICSFGAGLYTGIQNGGLKVIDEGLTHPFHNIYLEWYLAQAIWSDLAVSRVSQITDVAVTAS